MRESTKEALVRWKKLEMLQKTFPSFPDFLDVIFEHLGFEKSSETQRDIAEFLQYGPQHLMIQAQRGQAKTTITAAFAVWMLIHDPNHRILIVSGGGSTAKDIATLVIRIITQIEFLECMRPDIQAGDRSSVEGFDVHHSFRNPDKSASIACVGITGTTTSKRADLLIADDIETSSNSDSSLKRENILAKSKEFTDLCSTGRIVYLGTPQSIESIYNTLPSRNYHVRIWPGRYPTPDQIENYNGNLAPLILKKIKEDPSLQTGGGASGDQGKTTDERLNEKVHQNKEWDKGTADYQLQYMLNTSLSDKERYPLKTEKLLFMRSPGNRFPLVVNKDPRESSLRNFNVHGFTFKTSSAMMTEEFAELQSKIMYIDPAGGGKNGDETGYCVMGLLNSNLYLLEVGGIPGGYDIQQMETLAEVAKRHKVHSVVIEKNFGYGSFREVFHPVLRSYHSCAIEDDMVHGQKEKRIAEVLGPIIGRNSLIVLEDCIEQDVKHCYRYGAADRQGYSFFFQFARLMLVKDALVHDDRLDAVAGAAHYYSSQIAINQGEAARKLKEKEHLDWLKDPVGHNRYNNGPPKKSGSMLNKYRR